ncbi:MAG: ankyrin repeat domain-containing protein [Myxococcota bacterium]
MDADEFLRELLTRSVTEVARLLAESPKLANAADESNVDSALLLAVQADSEALVRCLLEAGADVHRMNVAGFPPYRRVRSVAVGQALEEAGADWTSLHGTGALIDAFAANLNLARWLLERGARPVAVIATRCEFDAEVLSVLVSSVSPDEREKLASLPFALDLDTGNAADAEAVARRVRRLLEAGISPNEGSLLQTAAAENHAGVVRQLVGAGAVVDAQDKHGDTALVSAAFEGAVEAVRVLLELGADPDQPTGGGQHAGEAASSFPEIGALLKEWRERRRS